MKNTFGDVVSYTIFGESHQDMIGIVIDGLCPGLSINEDFIRHNLWKRRPDGNLSTQRIENDNFSIVSGVYSSKTTGTPLCLLIPNENVKSNDYENVKTILRPSHADFSAYLKYHGFEDKRGGGHFSGRLTAPIVACGAIAMDILSKKGIKILTHIKKIGDILDRDFDNINDDYEYLKNEKFAVLSKDAKEKMKEKIKEVKENGDSIGGILESVVTGMPGGVGEPWFDSVESKLSHALFSIPALKGVEFGKGFEFGEMLGSKANDMLRVENGKIITLTNNNGGINGGITNGMDIVLKTVIKPTPSIYKKQLSVDYVNLTNEELKIKGRHDPCVVQRAVICQDSIIAMTLLDMLSQRFGTDYFLN